MTFTLAIVAALAWPTALVIVALIIRREVEKGGQS